MIKITSLLLSTMFIEHYTLFISPTIGINYNNRMVINYMPSATFDNELRSVGSIKRRKLNFY